MERGEENRERYNNIQKWRQAPRWVDGLWSSYSFIEILSVTTWARCMDLFFPHLRYQFTSTKPAKREEIVARRSSIINIYTSRLQFHLNLSIFFHSFFLMLMLFGSLVMLTFMMPIMWFDWVAARLLEIAIPCVLIVGENDRIQEQ